MLPASSPPGLPMDASLIGAHDYTQFWGIEGLTLRFSNAVDTALGGNR